MQDGVHVVERPDNMTGDLYKLLKSQDLGYVQTVVSTEEKVSVTRPSCRGSARSSGACVACVENRDIAVNTALPGREAQSKAHCIC